MAAPHLLHTTLLDRRFAADRPHAAARLRGGRVHLLLPALQRDGGGAALGRTLAGASRIYARAADPPGMRLPKERLLKVLNGLKYEQRAEETAKPGEFAVQEKRYCCARAPRTR